MYLTTGCEINFTQLSSNFGNAALNRYGNIPRTWNLESAIELQHELMPRLSVSGAWFHGDFHNLTSTYHTEWTYADYTPIQIFNPMTGTPITVYNRSAAANSRPADILDSFDPERQRIYNSYSFEFNARPGGRARDVRRPVGRAGTERQLHAAGQSELAALLRRTAPRGRLLRFRCARTCDWPARCRSKYGITISGSLQSNRGVAIGTTPATGSAELRHRGPTTRYPANARRRARRAPWSSVRR